MAQHRNHIIHSADQADLKRLKEEYEMLGRYCTLKDGELTVHALDPRYGRSKKSKN